MRRHTAAAAALSACSALLAGCGQADLGAAAAAAAVPVEQRTDEVRCREAAPRLESLTGALETLELANVTTFDGAHTLTTSALSSWVSSFEDATDGPLAAAHQAGEHKLAHLERIDATTPQLELLEWIDATVTVTTDTQAACDELTTPW